MFVVNKEEEATLFAINNNGRLSVKATAHQYRLPKTKEKIK